MSRFFLTLLLFSNFKYNWEFFPNFVAFSEYMNIELYKKKIVNCWIFWQSMTPENSKFHPIVYYLTRFFMGFLRIFQASFSHLSCKDYRYAYFIKRIPKNTCLVLALPQVKQTFMLNDLIDYLLIDLCRSVMG